MNNLILFRRLVGGGDRGGEAIVAYDARLSFLPRIGERVSVPTALNGKPLDEPFVPVLTIDHTSHHIGACVWLKTDLRREADIDSLIAEYVGNGWRDSTAGFREWCIPPDDCEL